MKTKRNEKLKAVKDLINEDNSHEYFNEKDILVVTQYNEIEDRDDFMTFTGSMGFNNVNKDNLKTVSFDGTSFIHSDYHKVELTFHYSSNKKMTKKTFKVNSLIEVIDTLKKELAIYKSREKYQGLYVHSYSKACFLYS